MPSHTYTHQFDEYLVRNYNRNSYTSRLNRAHELPYEAQSDRHDLRCSLNIKFSCFDLHYFMRNIIRVFIFKHNTIK